MFLFLEVARIMRKRVGRFAITQILFSCVVASHAWSQANPLPCSMKGSDPLQPWIHKSKVLDSFPKDNPLPRFLGTFRDRNQKYMLDLYRDSQGIFGELSSPIFDADSPTSRLYDASFDSHTKALQFLAKFPDGELRFRGVLQGNAIQATVEQNDRTLKANLKRKRNTNTGFLFSSRAQFECAMTLWRRF